MSIEKKDIELESCPFCGHEPLMEIDPDDILYPNGIFWREHPDPEIGKHYIGRSQWNPETDHACWNIVCQPNHGGCGVTMDGDSFEDVIDKWNTRI